MLWSALKEFFTETENTDIQDGLLWPHDVLIEKKCSKCSYEIFYSNRMLELFIFSNKIMLMIKSLKVMQHGYLEKKDPLGEKNWGKS